MKPCFYSLDCGQIGGLLFKPLHLLDFGGEKIGIYDPDRPIKILEKCVGINGALAAAVRPRENPERGPVKMARHYSAAMASCFSLRRSRDTLDLKTERRSLLNVLLLTSIKRTRCEIGRASCRERGGQDV